MSGEASPEHGRSRGVARASSEIVRPGRTAARHDATVEQVKEIARQRFLDLGEAGLSLRAIARDLGVVPSALYRYFPSHGHLLDALANDAIASLLDHLSAADAALPAADFSRRWDAAMVTYRGWVHDHQPGYSLNFGALSGDRAHLDNAVLVVDELAGQLSTILLEAHHAGVIDLSTHAAPLQREGGPVYPDPLTARAHRSALLAWTIVHGVVALEVTCHLPRECTEPAFRQQVRVSVETLGLPLPAEPDL